jgi:hypothetical protein
MNCLIVSFVMELIGFISIVPAGLLTLDLFAGSYVTKGKQPIFPSKVQFLLESNLGRARTVKI